VITGNLSPTGDRAGSSSNNGENGVKGGGVSGQQKREENFGKVLGGGRTGIMCVRTRTQYARGDESDTRRETWEKGSKTSATLLDCRKSVGTKTAHQGGSSVGRR